MIRSVRSSILTDKVKDPGQFLLVLYLITNKFCSSRFRLAALIQ